MLMRDSSRNISSKNCSPVSVRVVHEEHLLGSAGTLAANREWIDSDPAFWILYSDVLTNMDLRPMTEFHVGHGAVATLGLYQVPDPFTLWGCDYRQPRDHHRLRREADKSAQ